MNTYNITLVKHHPNIQLGHLYEHIITRNLNELFFDKGLVKSVDYALHGSTYENGIIIIDIDIYNNVSLRIIKKIIRSINPAFDDDIITTALFQITTEEGFEVGISSSRNVIDSLIALNAQPWQQLDNIETIDTQSIKIRNNPVWLRYDNEVNVRTVLLSIELPRNHTPIQPSITPLFLIFAKALLLLIGDRLARAYGFYSGEIFVSNSGTKITAEYYTARKPYSHKYSRDSIQSIAQASIETALKGGFTHRLINGLRDVSFSRRILQAPNTAWLTEHTGVVVGKVGWQKLATKKNIAWLADAILLTVRLGKFKQID